MTDYSYPTDQEIEAIMRKARQLQAQTVAAGFRSIVRRMTQATSRRTNQGGVHS